MNLGRNAGSEGESRRATEDPNMQESHAYFNYLRETAAADLARTFFEIEEANRMMLERAVRWADQNTGSSGIDMDIGSDSSDSSDNSDGHEGYGYNDSETYAVEYDHVLADDDDESDSDSQSGDNDNITDNGLRAHDQNNGQEYPENIHAVGSIGASHNGGYIHSVQHAEGSGSTRRDRHLNWYGPETEDDPPAGWRTRGWNTTQQQHHNHQIITNPDSAASAAGQMAQRPLLIIGQGVRILRDIRRQETAELLQNLQNRLEEPHNRPRQQFSSRAADIIAEFAAELAPESGLEDGASPAAEDDAVGARLSRSSSMRRGVRLAPIITRGLSRLTTSEPQSHLESLGRLVHQSMDSHGSGNGRSTTRSRRSSETNRESTSSSSGGTFFRSSSSSSSSSNGGVFDERELRFGHMLDAAMGTTEGGDVTPTGRQQRAQTSVSDEGSAPSSIAHNVLRRRHEMQEQEYRMQAESDRLERHYGSLLNSYSGGSGDYAAASSLASSSSSAASASASYYRYPRRQTQLTTAELAYMDPAAEHTTWQQIAAVAASEVARLADESLDKDAQWVLNFSDAQQMRDPIR